MKQIILISRIHRFGGEEEFSKYTDKYKDDDEPFLTVAGGNAFLLLIRGSSLRDSESKAEAIFNIVDKRGLDKDEETLVAYHWNYNIVPELRNKFTNSGWTNITDVKRYSSGGKEANNPLYKILNELGAELKAGRPVASLIDRLWGHLAHDPKLEAKLRLLQKIVSGETLRGSGESTFQLEGSIGAYQPSFDEFSKHDLDVFGLLRDGGKSPEQKQEAFNRYRDAFEKFREILFVG
jgi:hypothetical protein